MDPTTNLVEFSSQNLEACTNNFSQNNLIGLTQFGRLYRGNLEGQHVVVKIWDGERMKQISSKYNDENLIIKASYPNLVKLIGYTWERDVKGLVYDLNPLDTLDNAGNLNWLRRINVIHELAKLLKFIHDLEKQNMVLNISASHILLDNHWEERTCKHKLGQCGSYLGQEGIQCYCAEDGVAMTQLALQCIEFFPTMRDVLLRLDNLLVLQRLADGRATKWEKQFISS
ncbi:putative cysteine-rich receptor-like protein kinase 35 [Glycine soja]